MFRVRARFRDDRFTALGQLLRRYAREEADESRVVVLPPTLARMVVALGAFDANAQEQLTHAAARELGLVDRFKERGRTFILNRPLRRQNVTDHLVVRPVRCELPSQPASESHGRLWRHLDLVGPEQIRPLHRPVGSVLGPIQQFAD